MSERVDTGFNSPIIPSMKSYRTKLRAIISSILINVHALVRFGNPVVILVAMHLQYSYIRKRIPNYLSRHSLPLSHIRRLMKMQFSLQFSQTSLGMQFAPHRPLHRMKSYQNLMTTMTTTMSYLLLLVVRLEDPKKEEFVVMKRIAKKGYSDVEDVLKLVIHKEPVVSLFNCCF